MPDKWRKVAILYDAKAKYSPSNGSAIDLFCEAAYESRIAATILRQENSDLLSGFEGLFIRDTTHPGNYTFEWALCAEAQGITCYDSSQNITKGCNKFWQWEQFKAHKIPHPKTCIVAKSSFLQVACRLEYPCVIKLHDSCFSQGVYYAQSSREFTTKCIEIFRTTSAQCLLVQEFIKTDYDWRLTFFGGEMLFACKYYMAEGDFKIVKYDRQGNYSEGKHENVPKCDVPGDIYNAASRCLDFWDGGLCGIDLKSGRDGQVYVIELNDNPSIDHGVEDGLEGFAIYQRIMESFASKKSPHRNGQRA